MFFSRPGTEGCSSYLLAGIASASDDGHTADLEELHVGAVVGVIDLAYSNLSQDGGLSRFSTGVVLWVPRHLGNLDGA